MDLQIQKSFNNYQNSQNLQLYQRYVYYRYKNYEENCGNQTSVAFNYQRQNIVNKTKALTKRRYDGRNNYRKELEQQLNFLFNPKDGISAINASLSDQQITDLQNEIQRIAGEE